jgi:hypothetical protein
MVALLLQGGLALAIHHLAKPHTHSVSASSVERHGAAGGHHHHGAAGGHHHHGAHADHAHADIPTAPSNDDRPLPDQPEAICSMAAALGFAGKTMLPILLVFAGLPISGLAIVAQIERPLPPEPERFSTSPRAPPTFV